MEKLIAGLMLVLAVTAPAGAARKGGTKMGKMHVSSPAFAHGSSIPTVHTCDGRDASPPLDIGGVPEEAKSLVLIMDDPDAPVGTWVHWVVWNIPPGTGEIWESSLPPGSVEGRNSWKRNGYGGPCPPSGSHRYFFK
ncbi:MAG TPA: YbhB/YbcL family Raf kinase inhibitor-like protein, partial [Geobacteraceae bacterium]